HLFAANQRPAIDVGLSISRVGGKAQLPALRAASGRLRLDYAQFLELEMFTRFGGLSDTRIKAQIARGERIRALIAQPRFAPLRPVGEIALLFALADGVFDACAPSAIAAVRVALPARLDSTGITTKLGPMLIAGDNVSSDDRTELIRIVRDLIPQSAEIRSNR
ncbi:F0F1 ATP synthase subunit alpha, partial [Burkholderia contaminans]|nr:F0F1 ATP synthase subunit alpha [Burkholderia contaminans]